jgi:hypothetical protein
MVRERVGHWTLGYVVVVVFFFCVLQWPALKKVELNVPLPS